MTTKTASEITETRAEYVVTFTHESAAEKPLVGGKGANLGLLTAAAFPVPPGFSVTTDAYEAFLDHGDLDGPTREIVGVLNYESPEELEQQTAQIRQLISNAEMPADVAKRIRELYSTLGNNSYVAVRSSGTAEDMAEASFAGLHDTYLDVVGADAVIDAVKRCWASMWTARATSYRNTLGFDHMQARIAVVVQRMIESEVSGVMFTGNPLTARTDEIVINASWGLGEGIVSGILTPDEYTLDGHTMAVKKSVLGTKEKRIVRDQATGIGTVEQAVPEAEQAEFSLTEDGASGLAELGRRVMEHYGGLPQDIEWAYTDGAFYLLQSRPATGVDFLWSEDLDPWQTVPEDDDTLWTAKWAEEYWTGAITPLFYSVRGQEFLNGFTKFMTLVGLEETLDLRWFKWHRATAYYNIAVDLDYTPKLYPQSLRLGTLRYLPESYVPDAAAAPTDVLRFLRAVARINLLSPTDRWDRWHASVRDYIDNRVDEANGLLPADLRKLTDGNIKRYIARMKLLAEVFMDRLWIGNFVCTSIEMGVFAQMLAKWYDGDNAFVFQDLISGIPVTTLLAQETHDLFRLAERIRNSSTLLARFRGHEGADFFGSLDDDEDGRDFLAAYSEFLRDNGHRGQQDRDMYYARRVEDPRLDYEALRTLLNAEDPVPPWENEARVARQREEVAADVLERISRQPLGLLKAEAFKMLHAHIMSFLRLRDDWRHYIDRVTLSKKRAFLELGLRAVERGILADADDVFFLGEDELYDLLEGRASLPLAKAKIANRRRVFQDVQARRESPVTYLRGAVPVDLDAAPESADGGLVGMGTSRGSATGIARVVPELKDIGRVQKGDILICHGTDPGWAPVFTVIQGLVIETGGMLAHGSCLSREYGIPAVQLRNAIQRIPDGTRITVNGDTGQVTVSEAEQ